MNGFRNTAGFLYQCSCTVRYMNAASLEVYMFMYQ